MRAPSIFFKARDNALHIRRNALRGIYDQDDPVRILCPAPGGINHCLFQPAGRFENARRIDKDNLTVPFEGNCSNARARRLHLRCDNGDFRAYQLIEQGRFAGIRRADKGDITAPRRSLTRLLFTHLLIPLAFLPPLFVLQLVLTTRNRLQDYALLLLPSP
eukprot:NODE_5314_length_708_cov_1.277108_g5291_i0.p1 GENE.NODE_5314_length_708_cov_1.277108_g5291_i0~~NODE_5314_length_708_cov_1.277108_g5291_i0.p1  ORF type:complete len:161 (+),score=7.11 NODE_5314_length_708_cov_1.277108_g5291_i0:117-599(+)